MEAKIAIDSAIFFFCFKSSRVDINPPDIKRLLRHLSNADHTTLFVPISVIGESVIECLKGERDHNLIELHDLIDFWGSLNLNFLYPNSLVAEACYRLVEQYRLHGQIDHRLSDTDLVHLGYALAYEMDYFFTTDKNLGHYAPMKSKLQVIDQNDVKCLVRKTP